MTIGWPSRCDKGSAIRRAEVSTPPPAGQGTISLIGRLEVALCLGGHGGQHRRRGDAKIDERAAQRSFFNGKNAQCSRAGHIGSPPITLFVETVLCATALRHGKTGRRLFGV